MSTIPNKTMGLCHRSYNSQKLPESLLTACIAQKIDNVHNALLVALSKAKAIAIEKYRTLVGRGKVYWAYYVTKDGKKRATFLSPKAFQGYRWFDDFSTVVNMESGKIYQVSDRHCTCKSWDFQVKTGKRKTCKHQRMRQLEILRHKFPVVNLSDSLPSITQTTSPVSLQVTQSIQAKTYKIDPTIVRKGLNIVPSSPMAGEYDLKAWHKNTPLSIPALKRIGQISLTAKGFIARGIGGKLKKTFSCQTKAIDWIINSIGSTYEDLLAAYLEANPEVEISVASHQSSQKPNRANSRMRYQRQYSNDLAAPLAFANAFGGF